MTNPSGKTVSYWVNFDGHTDFNIKNCGNIDEDCVKIEPKQSVIYKVQFKARISIPVEGRYYIYIQIDFY